jgi:hypothetical protein
VEGGGDADEQEKNQKCIVGVSKMKTQSAKNKLLSLRFELRIATLLVWRLTNLAIRASMLQKKLALYIMLLFSGICTCPYDSRRR